MSAGMNPMAVFLDQLGESTRVAQTLRSAAQQQQQFQQEMRLRNAEFGQRQDEFNANQQYRNGEVDRQNQEAEWQRKQQGFTDLLSALANGGQAVSPQGTRVVTPPGSGQGFYIPTQQEQAEQQLREKVRQSQALDYVQLPPEIAAAVGMKPGESVPKSGYDTMLGRYLASKTAAESKPDKNYTFFHTPPGDVFAGNPATGEVRRAFAAPAQPQQPDAPKPATPAQLNSIENRKRIALTRAEAAFKKSMSAATVGGYTDTDQAGQALADLHTAKQGAQDAYEQELTQYGLPAQHFEYPDEKGPASAANAGGAQPAQSKPPQQAGAQQPQQKAPKSATLDQVRSYAKQRGVSEAAAIREFKQFGYSIAGQR